MALIIYVCFVNLTNCLHAQRLLSPFLDSNTAFVPLTASNTNELSFWQGQNQNERHTDNIPVIPDYAIPDSRRQATGQIVAPLPWAAGAPNWFFPSDPQTWSRSCRATGCSLVGTHCVFWGSFCPSSVHGVPCTCRRGCKVGSFFIPFGESRIVDVCNNICSCRTQQGRAPCTTRRC